MTPGDEEQWTISVQHTEDDVQKYIEAFDELLQGARRLTHSRDGSARAGPVGPARRLAWEVARMSPMHELRPMRPSAWRARSRPTLAIGSPSRSRWTARSAAAELDVAAGQTVTPDGIGGEEALRIWADVLAPATISTDHPA